MPLNGNMTTLRRHDVKGGRPHKDTGDATQNAVTWVVPLSLKKRAAPTASIQSTNIALHDASFINPYYHELTDEHTFESATQSKETHNDNRTH